MSVKKISALSVLSCALAFAAAAQSAQPQNASSQAIDTPTISIESGFLAGYSIGASDVGSALDFALGIGISDRIQAQLVFIQGDSVFDSYRLFGLGYAIAPRVGVTTLVGKGTASGATAGLGLYYSLVSRNVSGSLQTNLKLRLGYLSPMADFAKGSLYFGLAAALGF